MGAKIFWVLIGFFLISIMVCTVNAYNTDEVDITIRSDGSAEITADYSLNWGEYFAYNLILNREAVLEDKIEKITGKDVTVNYVTSGGASVTVPSFAKILITNGVYIYNSPKLPYNKAGGFLDEYMGDFSLLKNFSPDAESLVPDKTVITFPDGYTAVYSKPYPGGIVPSVTH